MRIYVTYVEKIHAKFPHEFTIPFDGVLGFLERSP